MKKKGGGAWHLMHRCWGNCRQVSAIADILHPSRVLEFILNPSKHFFWIMVQNGPQTPHRHRFFLEPTNRPEMSSKCIALKMQIPISSEPNHGHEHFCLVPCRGGVAVGGPQNCEKLRKNCGKNAVLGKGNCAWTCNFLAPFSLSTVQTSPNKAKGRKLAELKYQIWQYNFVVSPRRWFF